MMRLHPGRSAVARIRIEHSPCVEPLSWRRFSTCDSLIRGSVRTVRATWRRPPAHGIAIPREP